MAKPLALRIDRVHEPLDEGLHSHGFRVEVDLYSTAFELGIRYPETRCLIVRSRIPVDAMLMQSMPQLECIVRVGSGTEGIDLEAARQNGIAVYNTPEGNRNAVGEHALGLLLNLMRKVCTANNQIRQGVWNRRENTGVELEGKTVGIIGYGNTGRSFARKLAGFDVEVLAYDIVPGVGDKYARQVEMDEIFQKADVVSLHVPLTPLTRGLVNAGWIGRFGKAFWLINTSRGEVVDTAHLLQALEQGRLHGAALDVVEYEQKAFGNETSLNRWPEVFHRLAARPDVIITPHIAGLTRESYRKLARTALEKILRHFGLEENK